MDKPKNRAIAVDFDKTLAEYQSGDVEKYGPEYVGPPIEEMVRKVKAEIASGTEVFIFTARTNPGDDTWEEGLNATISYLVIADWCKKHLGKLLPISHEKAKSWDEIWDDHGIGVVANTGIFVTDLLEAESSQAK